MRREYKMGKQIMCLLAVIGMLCIRASVITNAQVWQTLSENQAYEVTEQVLAGWQETDGRRYYYIAESGQLAQGWQEIDGKSYYFEPETGELMTGCQELEDGMYYFSEETGAMRTGWQTVEGEKRYFSISSGRMVTGWQKIGGKRYYFSKNTGEVLTGLQQINGTYYIFDGKGRLAESKDVSLITVGSSIYCADKNGKASSGWHLIGKKLYYASKKGKVKKNTTYQGITFGSKGAAKDDTYSRLKIKAMQTIASITNAKMSKSQKLEACWSYIVGGKFRYAVKYPDLNASGWQKKTAYDMLTSGSGNCYGFACAFAALAQEIGYEPYIVCGRVRGSRDRAADGYTRHAWVRINGRYFDPEAQYAGWRRGIYGSGTYTASHMVGTILKF